jgi:hypothetical protein
MLGANQMTRAELLEELIRADGAILCWQLPKAAVDDAVKAGFAFIDDESDCLVHSDAIKTEDGAFMMKPELT